MSSLAARRAKAGADHASPTTATEAFNRMNERPRDVRLNEITLDLGLQFRLDVKGTGGIDEKHVLDLMHVIADGADTDPVILYRVDKALLMVDGFHRFEAYQRSQRTSIPAIVRDGTYEDAEEAAENANLQFKKALGDESKKYIFARRVQRGYQTGGVSWNNLSDKAIAAELGVAYQTIDRWFEEIQSGVTFVTPAGHEISIQVSADRSVVYGRDGKRYEVEAIREANTKRAAEAAERRATEEAERKRTLSVTEKIRIITQYLIAKYRDDYAKKQKPLMDDPNQGFEWCFQVSNPASFVVDIDWERQFLAEYGAKPIHLYREFLRLADREVFTRADMDGWTDVQLEEWVHEMGRRPSRQPNTISFQQTGMAQPKTDVGYPSIPSSALGRHRLTEVAATDIEEHTTLRDEPPFRKGQTVEVFETMEKGIVHAVARVNLDWEVQVQLYEGIKTFHADELTRPFATGDRIRLKNTRLEFTITKIDQDGNIEITEDNNPEPFEDNVNNFVLIEPGPNTCRFKVGDRVILKRNPKPVSVVKSVRQLKDGTWQMTMTTAEGYEFYEVPANLDFAPVESAVVVESQAAAPPKATKTNGEYKPSNGTQTQMAENYMALMRLIHEVTDGLFAIKKFDFNLQYLQTPETLAGIWDTLAVMRDQAMETFTVVADRLNTMTDQGLPYDPKLAQETLSKGMQRART